MSGYEAGQKTGDFLINAIPYMGYAINGVMLIIVVAIVYMLYKRGSFGRKR